MTYRLLYIFFTAYMRLGHRLEIVGKEHIPAAGPVILCANHSSYFDSMLVGLCTPRPVRFLIYHSFYHHPLLGFIVRSCGGIPVILRGADRAALASAKAVLEYGGVLGVFPEGRLSRTGLPGSGKPGAALLAAATGACIVPISISGAYSVFPRGRMFPLPGRIRVHIHPPVVVSRQSPRRNHNLQETIKTVMARIRRGVDPLFGRRGKRSRRPSFL